MIPAYLTIVLCVIAALAVVVTVFPDAAMAPVRAYRQFRVALLFGLPVKARAPAPKLHVGADFGGPDRSLRAAVRISPKGAVEHVHVFDEDWSASAREHVVHERDAEGVPTRITPMRPASACPTMEDLARFKAEIGPPPRSTITESEFAAFMRQHPDTPVRRVTDPMKAFALPGLRVVRDESDFDDITKVTRS